MKTEKQILSQRERDINTRGQFARWLAVSVGCHMGVVALIFAFSATAAKPHLLNPGYMVNIVTEAALQPSKILKPEKPRQKKAKPKIKKKQQLAKLKPPRKNKRIVAKKTKPKSEKQVRKPKDMPEEDPTPSVQVEPPQTQPEEQRMAGEDFEYQWYVNIIKKRINDNWVTHGIDIAGYKRKPEVRFILLQNGGVEKVQIMQQSGSDELDQSGIEAIQKAAPFPALPEGYPDFARNVLFEFEYEQRKGESGE